MPQSEEETAAPVECMDDVYSIMHNLEEVQACCMEYIYDQAVEGYSIEELAERYQHERR